jgi:hypothetical protein
MKRKWLPVVVIVILHAAVLWHSAARTSASVDELSHLAAGLYSLNNLDFRINRVAPPLQNLVNAIPVALFGDYQLVYDNQCWQNGIWNGVGDQLLFANPNNFHQLLMLGRTGSIFLSILLCLTAFFWTKECWGYAPALVVLTLTAFEPNILAHGRLTTTDIAPTFCLLLAGYLFWRLTRRPTRLRFVLVGVGFGLMWYSKHSGIVLLPALFICLLIFSILRENKIRLFFLSYFEKYHPLVRHFFRAVLLTGFLFVIGFFVIWIGYGFEIGDSIPGPREPMRSYVWHQCQVPINTFLIGLGLVDHIHIDGRDPNDPFWLFLRGYLPAFSHWEGFFSNRAHLQMGHLGFFMGELSSSGWRSYYPVLFLIKTPLPLLAIFLLGAVLLFMRIVRIDCLTLTSLLVIPFVYAFVIIFFNTANIGYRHALPVVPFFIVLFAGATSFFFFNLVTKKTGQHDAPLSVKAPRDGDRECQTLSMRASPFFPIVFGALLPFWHVLDVLAIHPHYLEYFNSCVGGPQNGHRYAVDSNLDWGQDLLHLKRYLEKHELDDARLLYFGPKEYPDAYQIPHIKVKNLDSIESGTYIISASYLHGIGSGQEYPKLAPFRQREPDDYITYALFLYHMP